MGTLLSQKVYDQLYAALLDHRLKPGDRLNRRQVAQDLGVSVAPVLEAMTQMEWEGFLRTSPRVGTVVSSVTARQVLGKFRLREAIEAEAARLAAGPPLAVARERLERLAEKADAARSWSLANFKTEVAFHEALVAAADCGELSAAFAQVMRHSLFHCAHDLLPDLPERTAGVHGKLVAALGKANADAAERLVRSHLEPSISALERAVAREPVAEPQPIIGRAAAVSIRRRTGRTSAG
jgi:DNA-binding GntR family transcriptional regulator